MNDTPADILANIPVLLSAARHGSATQAALELGTTTATVLRNLAVLERALGTRLFDRTPGGLLPTPALERALPWAEQANTAAAQMKSEVAGLEGRAAGVVRLAVLPALSNHFVVPSLNKLLALYPDLVLELSPASAIVDLVMREADLAVRSIKPTTGDLIVKRLASFRLAVVCSPALRLPKRKPSLDDLPWLTWSESLSDFPEALWLERNVTSPRIVFRSSNLETLLSAAQSGVGALVAPEPLAALAGGLTRVPVSEHRTMPEGALWLVTHRALRRVPRIAAVWEWLEQTIDQFERSKVTQLRAYPASTRREGPRFAPSARK